MKKIALAMSGGVDSSVAALLLKQQGWDVLGIFMKNWEDDNEQPEYRSESIHGCAWQQDFDDVRQVCHLLDIKYTTFNFVEEYKKRVFEDFISELKKGRTPNPDILCNQEVKFQLFLDKALKVPDIDTIATGHFAAITKGSLCRPKDHNKDQTYFLYRINKSKLKHVVFPLADLTKSEVRKIAQRNNFPNADKKDSTGICFIGDINYQQFIDQYIEPEPGEIRNQNGDKVGKHQGLHHYTIGQRKGINIGGTGPYYVVNKDLSKNVLYVTNQTDDPLLFHDKCWVQDLHWLEDVETSSECRVQIRYRQQAQLAEITRSKNDVIIEFREPQRAITPGQAAVFYQDDIVLGGGVISRI